MLSLAGRPHRAQAVVLELQRVRARIEPKHFDDLLTEARRSGAAVCRELRDASTAWEVQKTPCGFEALQTRSQYLRTVPAYERW